MKSLNSLFGLFGVHAIPLVLFFYLLNGIMRFKHWQSSVASNIQQLSKNVRFNLHTSNRELYAFFTYSNDLAEIVL